MTNKTKVLIALLAVAALAEGWFISVTYNPENRLVPLNGFHFYNGPGVRFADDYVSAEGSWISDTNLANPIQSSKITCLRDSMLCFESRGQLSEEYLVVDTNLFDVETWNEREIVTKPDDAACTRYIMRLDRIQKQVTATRTTEKKEGCTLDLDDKPIHLYLGDGLEAWRKVRNQN